MLYRRKFAGDARIAARRAGPGVAAPLSFILLRESNSQVRPVSR